MYEISIEDEFSAAHFLKLYDGSWERRHGHNWKVSVVVRSDTLDSMEVVVDFEALKPNLKKVLSEFAHICFNDHPEFKGGRKNPSTENIAKLIHDRLKVNFKSKTARLVKVTVCETPDACASYYPNR
ncbi:MAG: 6-carboxytetrahydropterin synthase [Candidatus Omnitrophica bacterium]|nr:6-carboxytetrahydropterin synthase [Candidatus Omnitrophota bacterium]